MRRSYSSLKAAKLVPALPSRTTTTKTATKSMAPLAAAPMTIATTTTNTFSNNFTLKSEENGEEAEKPKALTTFNPLMTCILCGGYFVDATTIVECLDTFCKSCIVKYLEDDSNPKACPICEISINKNRPLQSLREDKLKQDIVYKLVPQIFKSEMQRRREYYATHSEAEPKSDEDAGVTSQNTNYFRPSDKISMSLEWDNGETAQNRYRNSTSPLPPLSCNTNASKNNNSNSPGSKGGLVTASKSSPSTAATKSTPVVNLASTSKAASAMMVVDSEKEMILHQNDENDANSTNSMDTPTKRYLLCPAGLSVLQLKKFIYNKYGLTNQTYKVDILYAGEPMADEFTLMDVAYIYSWGRNDPMRFYYRIVERPIRRMKSVEVSSSSIQQTSTKASSSSATESSSAAASKSNTKAGNSKIHGNAINTSKASTSTVIKSRSSALASSSSVPPSKKLSVATVQMATTTGIKRSESDASLNDTKPATHPVVKKAKTSKTITTTKAITSKAVVATTSSKINSNSLTDAKFSQSLKAVSAKSATSKAADFHRKSTSVVKQQHEANNNKSNTSSGSSSSLRPDSISLNLSNSKLKPNKHFVSRNNMITTTSVTTSAPSSSEQTTKKEKPFLSISSMIESTSKSPESSNTTDLWKVSSKCSTKTTGSPLSPPAIRIKLTTSPNSTGSSSSSGKQLIGQIISPIPPEVANELKKDAAAAAAAASAKSSSSSSKSSGGVKYKTMTSQGVQSGGSAVSSSPPPSTSSGTRPRGEMIHQIIDKMQSKGSFKSSCVNVTSTTPSLDALIGGSRSSSSANSSKESSPAPLSPRTISTTHQDDGVSTTTGDASPNGGIAGSTTSRSSGNLVLRISTKSLEVNSNNKTRHNSTNSASTLLTSAALSPSSLDSNSSSTCSTTKKSSKGSKRSNSADDALEQSKRNPKVVAEDTLNIGNSTDSKSKPPGSTVDFWDRSKPIIDLEDDNSLDEHNLVMDIDGDESESIQETEPTMMTTTTSSVSKTSDSISNLAPISVATTTTTATTNCSLGLQSPPPTPSPKSEPEIITIGSPDSKGNNNNGSPQRKTKSPSPGLSEKIIKTITSNSTPSINSNTIVKFSSNVPLDLSTTKGTTLPSHSVPKVTPANIAAVLHQPGKRGSKNKTNHSFVNCLKPTIISSSNAATTTPPAPMGIVRVTSGSKVSNLNQTSASNLQLISPTLSKSSLTIPKNPLVVTATTTTATKRSFPISTTSSGSAKVSTKQTDSASAIKKAAMDAASFFPINQVVSGPKPNGPIVIPTGPSGNSRVSYPPFPGPFGYAAGLDPYNYLSGRNAYSTPNLANMMSNLATMSQLAAVSGGFLGNPTGSPIGQSTNPTIPRMGKSLKDTIVPRLPTKSTSSSSRRNGMSSTGSATTTGSSVKQLTPAESIMKLMSDFKASQAKANSNNKHSPSSSNNSRTSPMTNSRSTIINPMLNFTSNLATSSSSSGNVAASTLAALSASTRVSPFTSSFNR